MKTESKKKSVLRKVAKFLMGGFIVIVLYVVIHFTEPIPPGPRGNIVFKGPAAGICHQIADCLHQYSLDHHGHYPDGESSTEVFQHLVDEKYLPYPEICGEYVAIPGKIPAEGAHLKPENVSWDVTCCVDSSAPDGLPIVFLTGYKVTYQAGARALPLRTRPIRTWELWWNNPKLMNPFIAVAYKGDKTRIIFDADADGSIPNFIPADFDPKGKTYRQLTP